MKPREPDWGVRLLLILGVVIVLAFSSLRLAAQTQPVAGLIAVAINGGVTGPPSLFPDGTTSLPGIAFASQPALGIWREGAGTLGLRAPGVGGAIVLRNDSGLLFSVGTAGVNGIWNITSGGALQNVSATSGTIVMATTTIFNASATLQNANMNFKDLNLFLTSAGQQGWCGNCTPAAAFDQTCVSGAGNGSLVVRDAAGVFKCYS